MKKLLAILFTVLVLSMSLVFAQETDVAESDIAEFRDGVHDTRLDWHKARFILGSQVSSDYIVELGGDASLVDELRDQIEDTSREELRDLITEIREETRAQVDSNSGDLDQLRTRIDDARETDVDLIAARGAYLDALRSFALERVIRHTNHLENRLERLTNIHGTDNADIIALQEIIDEINALDFEGAATGEEIRELAAQARELNAQYREIVVSLLETEVDVGDRLSDRVERAADRIEARDVALADRTNEADTTVEETTDTVEATE